MTSKNAAHITTKTQSKLSLSFHSIGITVAFFSIEFRRYAKKSHSITNFFPLSSEIEEILSEDEIMLRQQLSVLPAESQIMDQYESFRQQATSCYDLIKMRTTLEKRARRSSVKTYSSGFRIVRSPDGAVLINGREPRIILFDCMQPVVLLHRIEWPMESKDDAINSDLSSPCSSQDEIEFRGFGSKDDSVDAKSKVDDSKSAAVNVNQTVLSKLVSDQRFQLYLKEVAANLAREKEMRASRLHGAYDVEFAEDGEDDYVDGVHQSVDENADDGISSEKTLTATDSEFHSVSELTSADAGSYAEVDEFDIVAEDPYMIDETVESSDMNVGNMVDVHPEITDDDSCVSDEDFCDAEEEDANAQQRYLFNNFRDSHSMDVTKNSYNLTIFALQDCVGDDSRC